MSAGRPLVRSASSTSCEQRLARGPGAGNRLTPMRLSDEPHGAPGRGLRAGGRDDPAADLRRDGAFGQRVDEGGRRDQPALRMSPAQQRLGAHHGIVGEPDLRLVVQLELVLGEGAPQLHAEPAPRLRPRPQHRQEEPVGAGRRRPWPGRARDPRWRSARRPAAPSWGAMAMPALPPRCSTCSLMSNGSLSRSQHQIDELGDHARIAAIGTTTTNSSPPSRHTMAGRGALVRDLDQALRRPRPAAGRRSNDRACR